MNAISDSVGGKRSESEETLAQSCSAIAKRSVVLSLRSSEMSFVTILAIYSEPRFPAILVAEPELSRRT